MADNNMNDKSSSIGTFGSFAELKNEKELNSLRVGKSAPAMVITLAAAIFLLFAIASKGASMKMTSWLIGAILLVVGIVMNASAKSQAKRIRAYEAAADRDGNTSIYDLAAAAGRGSVDKAVADLQLMISKGFWRGAYIDRENMMLVMTKDGKAIESVEESAAADKSARRKAARAKGLAPQNIDDLLLMTDDAEIKAKLTTLKGLTEKIDKKVEESVERKVEGGKVDKTNAAQGKTSLEKQVKEFKEQYFPAVVQMTDNYNTNIAKLEGGVDRESKPDFDVAGTALADEAKGIKKQLLDTIDSVIEASENLIERLYEDDILDITTDITSLKTTLASRGLLDSDFDIKL